MKDPVRKSIRLLAAGLVPTLFIATSSMAATVTANDVYLRSYVKSYTVGSLKKGQAFRVQYSKSGFHWGYAGGDFKGCAWVATGDVKSGGGQSLPTCPAPPTHGGPTTLINGGYAASSPAPTGSQDVLPKKYISCSSAGMYGNYRRGKHYEKFLTLNKNTKVAWRYETPDHRSAMIFYEPNTQRKWGFIRSSCLSDKRS